MHGDWTHVHPEELICTLEGMFHLERALQGKNKLLKKLWEISPNE